MVIIGTLIFRFIRVVRGHGSHCAITFIITILAILATNSITCMMAIREYRSHEKRKGDKRGGKGDLSSRF